MVHFYSKKRYCWERTGLMEKVGSPDWDTSFFVVFQFEKKLVCV